MPEQAELSVEDIAKVSLTPSELTEALRYLISPFKLDGSEKKQSVAMIWGPPGIGKTEIVRQVAASYLLRTVALHLGQYDPTDIKGIPVRMDNGSVAWIASSFLPQQHSEILDEPAKPNDPLPGHPHAYVVEFKFPHAEGIWVAVYDEDGTLVARSGNPFRKDIVVKGIEISIGDPKEWARIDSAKPLAGYRVGVYERCLLFLDEMSTAAPDVQNASLQLMLDRRVAEYQVPQDVPIVGAGNRESDAAFVNPISAPLANRLCHFTLMVDAEGWLAHAVERGVNPDIIGYILWKRESRLFRFVEQELNNGQYGFPTPRSWVELSGQYEPSQPERIFNATIIGHIGTTIGSEFIGYRKVYGNMPDPTLILKGQKVKLKDGREIRDLDIGGLFGMMIALIDAAHVFYEKYYDTKSKKGKPEWITAVTHLLPFLDEQFGEELTVVAIRTMTKAYKMPWSAMTVVANREFAIKYNQILRHTV